SDGASIDDLVHKVIPYVGRHRLGRAMARRARRLRVNPVNLTEQAFRALEAFVLSRPATDGDLKALIQAGGLSAFAGDRIGDLGPVAPSFHGMLNFLHAEMPKFGISELRAALRTATVSDLERARDELRELLGFFRISSLVLSSTTPFPDSFGSGVVRGVNI